MLQERTYNDMEGTFKYVHELHFEVKCEKLLYLRFQELKWHVMAVCI